jgi:hypothetical protein
LASRDSFSIEDRCPRKRGNFKNAKLKKLLAEAMLDISALKGVFGVKR